MITDLTGEECAEMLSTHNLARLACARDGQPYVVPISIVAEGKLIYSFATLGQKIEWMRTNPSVCVQVDRIDARDDWASVVVFGTYEEVPADAAHERERQAAWEILRKRPNWWEPAYAPKALSASRRELTPIYFRVRIASMTGHRMVPDTPLAL